MRVGLDLDNTIVDYSKSFSMVAKILSLVNENWEGNKTETKSFLCKNNEEDWMRLQGKVYGEFLKYSVQSPGLKLFLNDLKLRNIEIFIISHKTDLGHFDEKKVNLREAARKWLVENQIISNQSAFIKSSNIFFADTQLDKLKIINKLNLNYFIDDLPEIFLSENFPNKTIPVGFGDKSEWPIKLQKKIFIENDWQKISFQILNNKDHYKNKILQTLHEIANSFNVGKIISTQIVGGGNNSQVWKITNHNSKSFILKLFQSGVSFQNSRISKELSAQKFFNESKINNVAKAVKFDIGWNAILFEYIGGYKNSNTSKEDINSAINFLLKLQENKKAKIKLSYASDACKSMYSIVEQILIRRDNYLNKTKELDSFFFNDFNPVFDMSITKLNRNFSLEEQKQLLNTKKLIVSPSDFGFHNAIFTSKGIKWIDFEHFGLDDPVKTIADWYWHLGMRNKSQLNEYWLEETQKRFLDLKGKKRIKILWPFFGLKWVCIALNEFIPKNLERRVYSKGRNLDIDMIKENQIIKAKNLLIKVKESLNEDI